MNFDIAIHRLALSQSSTLGGAQLLVAKLRNDVELKAMRSSGLAPDQEPTADGLSDALSSVAEATKPLAVSPGAGHLIDKLA